MDDVVGGFNTFFVNVAAKLANQIKSDTSEALARFVRNPCTIFLKAVDEKEVRDIVSNFKDKTSTDCNEIDMTIMKKVIDGISQPLTHICNMSFRNFRAK